MITCMWSVCIAVVVATAVSCTPSKDSLADSQGLANLRYHLGRVEVDFGRRPPDCVELGADLRGTANGQPMLIVDHGHHLYEEPSTGYDGSPSPGFDLCIPPRFEAPNHGGGTALDIVIEDDSWRIHARFDDLFATRAITQLVPSVVRAGDWVELVWSPASDRLPSMFVMVWEDPTGLSPLLDAANTIVDGKITVEAPDSATPKALDLVVSNWASAISSGASVCEGVAGCDATPSNEGVLKLPFQIEP